MADAVGQGSLGRKAGPKGEDMKPVRTLRLQREALTALGGDELREVAAQAAVTPQCTPVILTLPVGRCLSDVLAECPAG